ncbi:MAG: M28 family peptidase [Gemmatimonadaceae bacterium]
MTFRSLSRARPMLAAALLATTGGCAPAAVPATGGTTAVIAADALMAHVSVLAADSMEGRLIGTPGNARARAYLVREFAGAGLQALGTGGRFELPVHVRSGRDSAVRTAINVVGMIRGRVNPDRYMVVTAHYDHLGIRNGEIYNGADDNASGTAALIEMARWFAANPPAHSLIFAAFDGEEGGLLGSRGFVASPPPPVPAAAMVLNVNLDMVGRNTNGELYAAGTSHYAFLRPYLDSVSARAPVTLRLGHDDPGGPRADDWTTQSDHASFHRAGIPFVYFGVEDHPDYHRPTDDTERLMPDFHAGAITTILDAIRVFDRNLTIIATHRP